MKLEFDAKNKARGVVQQFSNKFSKPAYKANNAKMAAVSKSTSKRLSISKAELISRKPKTPLHQKGKEKDSVIDSGASVVLANDEKYLDEGSLSTADANVQFPDSSGVKSSICGKIYGQRAHIVTDFDKNLFPVDFFTSQNAFLVLSTINYMFFDVRIVL